MRERIGEKAEVACDECFEAEHDLWETGEYQQREENSKAHGREKFLGESRLAVRLHAQIKTGGGAKCKVRGCIWSAGLRPGQLLVLLRTRRIGERRSAD